MAHIIVNIGFVYALAFCAIFTLVLGILTLIDGIKQLKKEKKEK